MLAPVLAGFVFIEKPQALVFSPSAKPNRGPSGRQASALTATPPLHLLAAFASTLSLFMTGFEHLKARTNPNPNPNRTPETLTP